MKKVVSMILVGLMMVGSVSVFADTVEAEVTMDIVTISEKEENILPTLTTVLEEKETVIEKPVVTEEGVLMLPLADVLRSLGYEVTWNQDLARVEIMRGAQWTSLKGGENAYTINRMAAMPLSAAPIYIDGVTYVPAEFFSTILNLSFSVDSGNITISTGMMAIHEGYVKEINYDETGTMSITLTTDMESDDIHNYTIIHTSNAFTYYQKEVKVGEYVKTVSPMMMTMSLPGQTSAYIIY